MPSINSKIKIFLIRSCLNNQHKYEEILKEFGYL
jgi:hypothetical protein